MCGKPAVTGRELLRNAVGIKYGSWQDWCPVDLGSDFGSPVNSYKYEL